MKCKKCNIEIGDNRYCSSCGFDNKPEVSDVNGPTASSTQTEEISSNNNDVNKDPNVNKNVPTNNSVETSGDKYPPIKYTKKEKKIRKILLIVFSCVFVLWSTCWIFGTVVSLDLKAPHTIVKQEIEEQCTSSSYLPRAINPYAGSKQEINLYSAYNGEFKEEYVNFASKVTSFSYRLDNEMISGDKAKVDLYITTYDFGGAFSEFLAQYDAGTVTSEMLHNKLLYNRIVNNIESNSTLAGYYAALQILFGSNSNYLKSKEYSTTITVEISKHNKKWEIDNTYAITNALTAGIMEYVPRQSS